MARKYLYLLLDVFTDTPLQGNQLAVFLDGAGLSNGEMQALARETNLSETTFCFPGERPPEQGVRVRIFTAEEELPFAGHPTLGTATALRCMLPALHGAREVLLQLDVGAVPVRFADGQPARDSTKQAPVTDLPFGQPIYGEMDQPLPTFGQRHDLGAVASALGLPIEAMDPTKPIETVSTGIPFVVVPVVSLKALEALAVPQQAAQRYLDGVDGKFFYVIAPGESRTDWHARMQFYSGEDPATGSAAGCATAYLVHRGYAPAATPLTLRQGVEMGRPSTLYCRASLLSGVQIHSSSVLHDTEWAADSYVRVGGSTILVAEGRFFLF